MINNNSDNSKKNSPEHLLEENSTRESSRSLTSSTSSTSSRRHKSKNKHKTETNSDELNSTRSKSSKSSREREREKSKEIHRSSSRSTAGPSTSATSTATTTLENETKTQTPPQTQTQTPQTQTQAPQIQPQPQTQGQAQGQPKKVIYERYERLPMLMQPGSFDNYFLAEIDGWSCIEKLIKLDDHDTVRQSIFREIESLEQLPPHPNVTRYLFHLEEGNSLRVFTSLYRMTLHHLIQTRLHERNTKEESSILFTDNELVRFSLDIIKGLEFLHKKSIMHRDLNPHNVLVALNERNSIKKLVLGNFDVCLNSSRANARAKTVVTTPAYMSPEIVWNAHRFIGGYSFSADVWAYGMLLFEMIATEQPYKDKSAEEIREVIGQGIKPQFPSFVEQRANEQTINNIIQVHIACTAVNPDRRPSVPTIKQALIEIL
eukprot:TRINITY_DN204_c1_g1_i1.p1 TRINITY_DN204_c1_g1~~TRINITY_DN204_c1_g1_i1.p1  ORF type:complete len:432 (-),score=187.55 TRINITY_DN204_c1_g1_i1:84-1379(-)